MTTVFYRPFNVGLNYVEYEQKEPEDLFFETIQQLFSRIEKNPVGKRLFAKMNRFSVPILLRSGVTDQAKVVVSNRQGEKTLVKVVITLSQRILTCFSFKGDEISLPPHVVLFHELIHAYHAMRGKVAVGLHVDPLVWESDEEFKTVVGFPRKKEKPWPKITENTFRLAEGLPERYGSFGPPSGKEVALLAQRRIQLLALNRVYSSGIAGGQQRTALVTNEVFGRELFYIVLIRIEGVDLDLSPKKGETRFFFDDITTEEKVRSMHKMAYQIVDVEAKEAAVRNYTTLLLPSLKTKPFKVVYLSFLRVTSLEKEVIKQHFLS